MELCIQRYSSAFRFLFIAFFCLTVFSFGVPCLAEEQDEADEESPRVVSSEVADTKLSEVMNDVRLQYAQTGKFSDKAKEALKTSVEEQFNSFVSNFQNEKAPESDPAVSKQFEMLAESRDAFVDARLNVAYSELRGLAVHDMVYEAFLDVCIRLGIRVGLNGEISEGAPAADTRIVTLMLPNMDCPGCAKIVRAELGKIDGVFDSVTNVEQGTCRAQVSADTKLDVHLDELAKTVVQFREWTKR